MPYVNSIRIGSLESAVEVLSVPLLVVLGHSRCSAVGATWLAVWWSGSSEGTI